MPSQISIHALLAESDRLAPCSRDNSMDFYPRSPCGERQLDELCRMMGIKHFYPRSPCGERHFRTLRVYYRSHFYPRSPCGERLLIILCSKSAPYISIHALLAESDNNINSSVNTADRISIHALLAESDSKSAQNSGALLRI